MSGTEESRDGGRNENEIGSVGRAIPFMLESLSIHVALPSPKDRRRGGRGNGRGSSGKVIG